MKGKMVSPEGKEVEMTEDIDDLTKHLCEAFDQLRVGIINVKDALAIAGLSRTIIEGEKLKLFNAQLREEKPDSTFLNPKILAKRLKK